MSIGIRIFLLLALIVPHSTGQPAVAADRVKVPLRFDHFYDFEELTSALHSLAEAYPQLLDLASIGKSFEGRDMWLMTIHNPKTGPEMEKAAMWIDGNIHGNEVQASEVCLYTIWYLMENYGRIEEITRIVDERVFYVLPSQNPDGRAHWFNALNTSSSSRSGKKPTDNDGDGLFDEDGYDDLDGDGELLMMRRKNVDGRWRPSHDDPRLMERAPAGEPGGYDILGYEGIDNDGDGRINEDGPGGYDLNRNWPSDWEPEYIQFGASEYPLCHPESKSISRFILAHPNIAGVQSYHNTGGMILRGPGSQSFGSYPRQDAAVYDLLGEKGEKILPYYKYMIIWKDLYTVYGGFVNWTYEGLGIFSFTNELFSSKKYYHDKNAERSRGGNTERLKFDDWLEFGHQYVEWKPATHPTYGDIELGGWRRETGRVPPVWMLQEECHRNFAFTVLHADQMPLVSVREITVKSLDQGVHEITATVENTRLIPSVSARAREKRIGLPDFFSIESLDLKVLSGGILTSKDFNRLNVVEYRPERIAIEGGVSSAKAGGGGGFRGGRGGGSGSSGPVTVRWYVTGKGTATLRYESQKGGVSTGIVTIK